MLRADAHDPRRARFGAILGIIGFIDVPFIRWTVEKWSVMHPAPVIVQEGRTTGLPPSMMLTFLVCLVAFLLLFFYLVRERVSLARSRHELEVLRHDIEDVLYR
jgi:heme exporter protein C